MLPNTDFSDGLLMDAGRSWVGSVCVITRLLSECMFAAVQNLALIQALQLHHQGEHGEQREAVISLGHGHFVLCLFGT